MANLNLIDKLGIEPQTITIAEGKTYTVNTGANTVMKAQALYEEKGMTLSVIYEIIEMLLGKQARDEIEAINYPIKKLSTIVIGIMAQVNEVSFEEMEARFRKD